MESCLRVLRAFAVVCLLPLVAVPALAVDDFETLVGEDLPSPTSIELKPYLLRLVDARVAECDTVVRGTTYYVDTTSTDGGTGTSTAISGASRAFATIGAVNTAIAGSSGYVTVLFRTGQTWYTSASVLIDGKDGVKIGSYTTDNVYTPPLISALDTDATGGWTSNADSGSTSDGVATYYRTLASEPGWLVETTSDFTKWNPIRHRTSLASCQSTARSWFWDSGASRLYIHYSADPASVAFRYSLEASADSNALIEVNNADLTLIEGLRLEGNGATAITNNSTSYAVRGVASIDRLVVRDCQAYYCGSHAFGSTGGGYCVFQRCKAGYCHYNTGTSTYVMYDDDVTGDEALFVDCEAMAGPIPNESISGTMGSLHTGFYAHRGVSGSFGLVAFIGCSEPQRLDLTNATQTYGYTGVTNVPGDSTPASMRAIWIDHRIDRPESELYHYTTPNNLYVNCLYRRWWPESDTSGTLTSTDSTGGYHYNCVYDFADMRSSTLRFLFRSSATFVNCSFFLNGNNASSWTFWGNTALNPRLYNCLISRTGTRQIVAGYNASSDYNSDTYWGTTATFGVSQATDYAGWGDLSAQVKLQRPLRLHQSPAGSLAETGSSTIRPDYDFRWRKRPTSGGSLGAIEAFPADAADMETILARIGPWTGDTAKNSIYGALRSMANADVDFTSGDLTKDDGDGAGTYNNENASLGGIRSITALAILQEDAAVMAGGSTSTIVGPASWSTVDDKYVGAKVVVYFAANAGAVNDVRTITDYVGSTRTATVEPAFGASVGSGDVAFILRGSLEQLTTTGQSAIAAATWDRSRASHVSVGSFGEGVASVQGNVTGSTASVTAGVTLADNAITSAKFATDSISAAALAAATGTEIANAIWDKPHAENIAASSKGNYLNAVGVYQTTLYGQMEDALEHYRLDELMVNPLSPQPASGSLFGDLTEDDGGDQRFRSNSLELAPTGSGGSGDPLSNAVPGSYASGTAGWVLGRVKAGAVTVVSPVSLDGQTLTLVAGDDYANLDGRALQWTTSTASQWPTLTGATITLTIHSASMDLISQAGSVVTDTGANKSVRVELTDTQTSTLTAETYSFDVKATLSNANVVTLVRGKVKVLQD